MAAAADGEYTCRHADMARALRCDFNEVPVELTTKPDERHMTARAVSDTARPGCALPTLRVTTTSLFNTTQGQRQLDGVRTNSRIRATSGRKLNARLHFSCCSLFNFLPRPHNRVSGKELCPSVVVEHKM